MEHQTHVLNSDKAISHLIKIINEKRATQFQECFYFGRYHNNYLVLWCRDIEKLYYHKMLNTLDEKLKFMIEIGGSRICFLYLKTFIEGNRLVTTKYSKPPDNHLYLEAPSCHKKSSKTGIIKGIALHLRLFHNGGFQNKIITIHGLLT